MSDILISGPNFFNYNSSIARGFQSLGHNTTVHTWINISNDFSFKLKMNLLKYLNPSGHDNFEEVYQEEKTEHHQDSINRLNAELLELSQDIDPDIILVLKGNLIKSETIDVLKEQSVMVLWCYDRAIRYPLIKNTAHKYDLLYSFEPTDIDELKNIGVSAKYLPLAYDPSIYSPIEELKKKIDICFVGNISYRHGNRVEILNKVSREFPRKNIQIWGKNYSLYNLAAQYKYNISYRKMGKNMMNMDISPEEVNRIYNKSKICINIHDRQSKEGMNPRTFEILGSSSFQLVDRKKKMQEIFSMGSHLVGYDSKKDLLDKIEFYLEHSGKRNRIAENGYEYAQKSHQYRNRAKDIIRDVEELGLLGTT